jgi:hypothetical protein
MIYNRFPYEHLFFKRQFITILSANVNILFRNGWHEIVKHKNSSKQKCHMADPVEHTILYLLRLATQGMTKASLTLRQTLKCGTCFCWKMSDLKVQNENVCEIASKKWTLQK